MPDLETMRQNIFSVSISDEETRKTIKKIYDRYGVLLEPHGAVGWRGLEIYLERFGDASLCVSLETAHPAKFPEEIEALLNVTPPIPPSMKDIDGRTGEPVVLSGTYDEFKDYLCTHLKIED
jgi:threonine synthase